MKHNLNLHCEQLAKNFVFLHRKISFKNAAFVPGYKPFAVCIAQYFPHACAWSYHT